MGGREINHAELVRLIGESLHHLGYQESYRCLLAESNIPYCSPEFSKFSELVLDGNWDAALNALKDISGLQESTIKSASFVIMEQHFLQLLEKDEYQEAVDTLKNKITPLSIEHIRVRELSSLILQRGVSHIKPKPNSELLATLRVMFPPDVVVPQGRLLQLVEQTLQDTYMDNYGEKSRFPTQTSQILKDHNDEVSIVLFSHNGSLLASGSKDKTAIIWAGINNNNLWKQHTLQGHGAPICCLSWSPDDQRLLTCGLKEDVRCWDVQSGTCLHVYRSTSASKMISCHWCPDGQRFITGMTNNTIKMWDLAGKPLDIWWKQTIPNSSNLHITRDGRKIVSLSREDTISFIDMVTGMVDSLVERDNVVNSFVMVGDHLLVSILNGDIILRDMNDTELKVLATYTGRICTTYVVRASSGGRDQALIASGSEDSQVFVWNRWTGELLKTLVGHVGPVLCTSWNPVDQYMLASGGADGTIRIWGLKPIV